MHSRSCCDSVHHAWDCSSRTVTSLQQGHWTYVRWCYNAWRIVYLPSCSWLTNNLESVPSDWRTVTALSVIIVIFALVQQSSPNLLATRWVTVPHNTELYMYRQTVLASPSFILPMGCQFVSVVTLWTQWMKLLFTRLHGKIGILGGFFGPTSIKRGRTHIVLGWNM